MLGILSLQFSAVQTYVTQKIASYLSDELNSQIRIERVYIKPFSKINLQEFSIIDQINDTVLYAKSLDAGIDLFDIFNKRITVNELKLDGGYLNYQIYKEGTNLSKYQAYFSPKKDKKGKTKSNKFEIKLKQIELTNNQFRLVNHKYKHPRKGVNFANLLVYDLSVLIDDIHIDSISTASIHQLTLKEKSGFSIKELTSQLSYSDKKLAFDDLILETNNSKLTRTLHFNYDKFSDFEDFINKVYVRAELKNSRIASSDIAFFAPEMKNVKFEAKIEKAFLNGTVKNINAKNVNLSTGKQTSLLADFNIKGLPNINKTVFGYAIKALNTDANDIENIISNLSNNSKFSLPQQIHKMDNINYKGTFIGLYNDFSLQGAFTTALGNINTKSIINFKNGIKYDASLVSTKFDINTLLGQNIVKQTAFDVHVNGKGRSAKDLFINFEGNLTNADIQNYKYNAINLVGEIANQQLKIDGNIDDQNLKLDYHSTIDWNDESPTYLLHANIDHAMPNNLGWLKNDSVIIKSAKVNTNLVGNSLNTLNGFLRTDSLSFSTSKGNFLIENLRFNAEGNELNRNLNLFSDVLDINMNGNIDLNTIIPYFRSLAVRYAPAIDLTTTSYNPQNFNLKIDVKSFKPISALLDPTLALDDGAQLEAEFSSKNYTAKFFASSPSVVYKGMKLSNLRIHENADNRAFSLNVDADRLHFADSTYINNIAIKNKLANDSLLFNIELSEKNASNYLDLHGDIHFAKNAPAVIHFNPSSIIINKENWSLSNNSKMQISKGKAYIENLILSQNKQRINLDGILSKDDDKLNIYFNNFNLTSLNGITKPLGIFLEGQLDGQFEINSVLKNPITSANIKTSPIIYNNISIGELALKAGFDPETGNMLIGSSLLDQNNRGVLLNGQYNFYNANEPLDLKGKLQETDLTIFQPFLKNLISKLKGKANAEIEVKGTLKNPKITGIGRFSDAEFTVNYLNTHYYLDNQVAMVDNNAIMLQNLTIRDSKGNKAMANGLVNLQKLANPYIDVDINGNNIMILNTGFKDNNLYYGTAFASGVFKFKGFTNAINIDINAKSESGTIITLPFNSAMTVSDNDFIYFVSKDSTENAKRVKKNLFKGLTMTMDLNFTPDAELNLQTSMGSLKGSGNGNVTMKISSLGDFEMFGDYVATRGKFHFTAQDFINKYFDIKEGGTVRWTGNPSEAVINLNAIYQQRTAIGPLFNAAGYAGDNERVLAQADMLIKGTLERPDVTFDINFPQNPYIKDQLQSFLSDANNVNQQALSLIVRRSFTPSSTVEIGKEVNNTLLSAGTEIAFNQLNSIISQSLNVNFLDLNIRSFNDASASLRLLNDRLVLSGGITDRTNYDATDLTFFRQGITTDAELTYRLRKDGNLLFRAYNRPYTRNFLIRSLDAEYISALGLVYRQEFNSLGEFWKKLWIWNSKTK